MTKKFELTDESIEHNDKTLYRIKALKDFYSVKAGELGGYVEKEDNLSHYGDCWVYDDAKVFDIAKVYGDADVYGDAEVFNNAKIYGNAEVFGNAQVFAHAEIFNEASISKTHDYITITSIGSEDDTLTAFKSKDGSIYIKRGCFKGSLNKFIEAVKITHGDNEYAQEYGDVISLIKRRLSS